MFDLIFGLEEVEVAAIELLAWMKKEQSLRPSRLQGSLALSLSGPMGSGKTTLIRAMGKYLGCNPLPTSPTFSLVQHYMTSEGEQVVHADLFRLRDAREWLALDPEMLLAGVAWLWVEWPEKALNYMPEGMAQFELELGASNLNASNLPNQRRLRFVGWLS